MSNILIGVTGGIAAYKVPDITSALIKNEHVVKIIMTKAAKEIITPLTLATISRHPIYDESSEWAANGSSPEIAHIELSKWADVFVIVPATANTITKVALGIADNLLTSTYLALPDRTPVLICPAMNTNMWVKPWIQAHLEALTNRPHQYILSPAVGMLACGDTGRGKLPATKVIVEEIQKVLMSLPILESTKG